MRRAVRLASTMVAVAPLVAAAAHPAPNGRIAAQTPTFSARTQGVLADVLVTRDGRPVTGLQATDFEVRDNGVVQTVDLVESADLPINVVLALDVSASIVGDRLDHLKTAAHALVDQLRPDDRAALTTFSEVVRPELALTTPPSAVGRAIDRMVPGGDTSLLDGLYVALMTAQAESGRSLVVLCTDGRDTASWLEAAEVLDSARRASAVVYVLATGSARRWATLGEIARATGGETIDLESSRDLPAQFGAVLQLFRSRYLLTFTPTGVDPAGYHELEVRLRRGGARVTSRPGYFAGAAGRDAARPR